MDRSRELTLMFDPEHALDDRITMEHLCPDDHVIHSFGLPDLRKTVKKGLRVFSSPL